MALAYQTVRCSALNAEELRREGGLEALLEAIGRCIPMIGGSSKPEDVAVQVCADSARCLAVAGRFGGCRDRLAEMKTLTPEICRMLSHRQLAGLCQAACECVASLAQDSVLQLQLLQAGALWHLLILLFDYDFTLDEGGVRQPDSSNNKQQVANTLAKTALFACGRLAGYLTGSDASPANTAVQEALAAMLTPYLAGRLGRWTAEEFLKVLTNNTESPVLIWDNGSRTQLLEFLTEQQRTHIRSGESDRTYGATYVHRVHAKELVIGGIFARVYNRQPDFQLDDPAAFVLHLLDFLSSKHETVEAEAEAEAIHSALQSLYYVVKANPAAGLQCLGRFLILFQLIQNGARSTAHLALQVFVQFRMDILFKNDRNRLDLDCFRLSIWRASRTTASSISDRPASSTTCCTSCARRKRIRIASGCAWTRSTLWCRTRPSSKRRWPRGASSSPWTSSATIRTRNCGSARPNCWPG